jgi:hypothetical protein
MEKKNCTWSALDSWYSHGKAHYRHNNTLGNIIAIHPNDGLVWFELVYKIFEDLGSSMSAHEFKVNRNSRNVFRTTSKII